MATDRDDAPIRLLGYWREELPEDGYPGISPENAERWERIRQKGLRWPDPSTSVDPLWRSDERRMIIDHLEKGTLVNQFRGLSKCRFCDRKNGSAELTDGTYCWPEGLPHYVRAHAVSLPHEFVSHVTASPAPRKHLPSPRFDDLGQRDRTWPARDLQHHLWAPVQPDDGYGWNIDPDPTWWLEQL